MIAEKRVFFDAETNRLTYFCPGCQFYHQVCLTRRNFRFDGDLSFPTVRGRILIAKKSDSGRPKLCLHTIRDGRISFAKGCWHEMAGKIVDLEHV